MADQPPLRLLPPGEPCPPGGSCVPVVDLTALLRDAYARADLLRDEAADLVSAASELREAADHLEALAHALDGAGVVAGHAHTPAR